MPRQVRISKLRQLSAVMGRARHPLLVGSLAAMVVAAVGWRYGVEAPRPAAALPVVEAPVRPVESHAPEDAERVIVTLRWGSYVGVAHGCGAQSRGNGVGWLPRAGLR